MPFESADAYRLFATSVKHDRRFIYEQRTESFLEAVTATSISRVQTLKAGQILWRAQLGSTSRVQDEGTPEEMEVEAPFFEGRMKPTPTAVARRPRKSPWNRILVSGYDLDDSRERVETLAWRVDLHLSIPN